MSDPIKTTPIMIRWGKDTVFNWSDDVTYYYKEEMVASGKKGDRTFEVTILKSDTPDFSVSTEIGTRNKDTGVITLNEGADLVEEAKLKTNTLRQRLTLLQPRVSHPKLGTTIDTNIPHSTRC